MLVYQRVPSKAGNTMEYQQELGEQMLLDSFHNLRNAGKLQSNTTGNGNDLAQHIVIV
jgi:hypothetical protein